MKKLFFGLSFLIVAAMVLVACQPAATPTAEPTAAPAAEEPTAVPAVGRTHMLNRLPKKLLLIPLRI